MRCAIAAAGTAAVLIAVAGLTPSAAAPAAQATAPPKVKIFQISIFPLPIQAGDDVRLTIVVKLTDGRTVKPTRTICLAELSGRSLPARVGRGLCRLNVPRNATGKSLSIGLSLAWGKTNVTKTLTYRVRARTLSP